MRGLHKEETIQSRDYTEKDYMGRDYIDKKLHYTT